MKFSLFHGTQDNKPKIVDYTWDEFLSVLLPHEFKPPNQKLQCNAFSPAYYPPNTNRSNHTVVSLSAWVGDLDQRTDDDIAHFVHQLKNYGWAAALYTTWSHSTKPNSLRAIVPLSRPILPDEWLYLWNRINHALGAFSDEQCKDPQRIYFGAYAPQGTEKTAFSDIFQGDPIDVDQLLGDPATREHEEVEKIERNQLKRFAQMLKRKRDEEAQEYGHLLAQIVDGEAFAEPGNRDNTIYRLSLVLAKRWPNADPKSIARHFAPSLALMGGDDFTDKLVIYKIKRAQDAFRKRHDEQKKNHEERLEHLIRDAFFGERSHPYTVEELEHMPANRWIIQRGKGYYTRVGPQYRGPYVSEEALSAVIRDLAPATTANVECYQIDTYGNLAPKSLGQLVRTYGTVADDVAIDLSAKKSYFDERSRILVEAPCPLRKIVPKFYTDIDLFLEVLAGERVLLLKNWLAALTWLHKPCTGLFLTGPKHTGKSVLPEGASRLWTSLGFPTPLEDVLGTNFNDAQLRCPLVFADERLPTDGRGRVLYGELRHYIQARRRPLRRKFLPNADMIGAIRLIVAANNENILATSEHLSAFDVGAIVDRWLHIPCQLEAYHFLKDVDTSGWVDRDMIAQHCLWLRDNHKWKPNGRFLVHGNDEDLHSRLITSSGPRASILQFCVSYLMNPDPVDNHPRAQWYIRVHKNQLYINLQALIVCWSEYVTNERCPTTGKLSQALQTLVKPARFRLTTPNNGRPNYRIIETHHLFQWGERHGFATKEEIKNALAISTEYRLNKYAIN